VDCFFLGHACWLFEASGLRILVDPLIFPAHQRGIFTTNPPRKLRVPSLRPDFVLVSHAHGDHFDPASLAALAADDPDTILVSADARVCRVAAELGFREARRIEPWSLIELDGVRLVTTPSAGSREWGVLLEHQGATVWHLVDTVVDGAGVRAVLERASSALGLPSLATRGPDLALVRYQPLLEVALALGSAQEFPARAYEELLEVGAALGSGWVVPSSAGSVHQGPFAPMNRVVYPQTERRFLRDLASAAPGLRGLPSSLGARYRVQPGEVRVEPLAGRHLIEAQGAEIPVRFRPFEPPPLEDDGWPPGKEHAVTSWVKGPLQESVTRAGRTGSLALEVIGRQRRLGFTLISDGHKTVVHDGIDEDHDLLNVTSLSALTAVLEGRISWVDALLAGHLRAIDRRRHTHRSQGDLLFVYLGLSPEESESRALEHEVAALRTASGLATSPPPI
jgi:hypothetical protein